MRGGKKAQRFAAAEMMAAAAAVDLRGRRYLYSRSERSGRTGQLQGGLRNFGPWAVVSKAQFGKVAVWTT